MQNLPLVTVYIPTFNRVELLKRAVKSVQDQTYKNLEIIIVDDCSTDGTHEYLEQISKEDHRVRYFLKETNSGACVSRNIAIENAKGEFITGLDDDDYFLDIRIEKFVKYFNSCCLNKNIVFLFDNQIIKKGEREFQVKKIRDYFKKRNITKEDLIFNNYIGNQIFIKTEIIQKFGGFDPKMPMWQDLECWYNILKNTLGVAVNILEHTYVHDISHEYERISNFKIEKGVLAHKNFSEKHNILGVYKDFLYTHLYTNDPRLIDVRLLILKIKHHFNIYDLKKILFNLSKLL
ncbi:glycosyltransferase family 2 protein [Acinetobacter sp. A2]|uniref:glycosyltransferase family 2 protein n=1 Tax=Acinetobacter sp. A2 TaxID=362457 RepID=UPI001445E055|nr:glycosyltransferase family 2 protein [Acinetobacter sp. A2]